MQIWELPTSRMKQLKNKVILVPLEDEDINRTIETLPRKFDDAELVEVNLKKMLSLKSSYAQSYISPNRLKKAIKKFQDLGNQHYLGIRIDNEYSLTDTDDGVVSEDEPMETNEEVDKETDDQEEDDKILSNVKEYQSDQNSHTCMVRENPECMVHENTGFENITVKKDATSKNSVTIAPGENKIPTNLMREKDFDVKANPILHPTGKYGLHHPRNIKLQHGSYFNQRLLNIDPRFAKNIPYIFMALYYLERKSLEGQISVAARRGQYDQTTKTYSQLADPFSIFQKLKGTPKYWKQVK